MKYITLMFLFSVTLSAHAETWSCANDFESTCHGNSCRVSEQDSFTPLSVSFNDSGYMTVCAYTGCWEGQGHILSKAPYLVIIGKDLSWNNPSSDSKEDVFIGLNTAKNIAMVNVIGFYQPMACSSRSSSTK